MTLRLQRIAAWLRTPIGLLTAGLMVLFLNGLFTAALAHGVAEGDKGYIQETSGIVFWPFVYLGPSIWSPATTICCSCSG